MTIQQQIDALTARVEALEAPQVARVVARLDPGIKFHGTKWQRPIEAPDPTPEEIAFVAERDAHVDTKESPDVR